ncbi:DUF397 domain-containing protein [Streptomyces sp. NPDC048669]|uniref:DUF397 domain-containing protein n=1 Tax=Streptomyces sp. NPDC048669 TaxID=3155267 RepID=UPI0034303E30
MKAEGSRLCTPLPVAACGHQPRHIHRQVPSPPQQPSTVIAPEDAWFKSSYSDGTSNNCVEAANIAPDRRPRLEGQAGTRVGPSALRTSPATGQCLRCLPRPPVDLGLSTQHPDDRAVTVPMT